MVCIRPAIRLGDDLYQSLTAMTARQELPEGARLPGDAVREALPRMREFRLRNRAERGTIWG